MKSIAFSTHRKACGGTVSAYHKTRKIHRLTNRQTDRQTDRQTERPRDREKRERERYGLLASWPPRRHSSVVFGPQPAENTVYGPQLNNLANCLNRRKCKFELDFIAGQTN